jgi:hypothetical protein
VKISELIAQLQKMPPDAECAIDSNEEFHSFTVGELMGDPAGIQMIPLVLGRDLLEEAAVDMLAALNGLNAFFNGEDDSAGLPDGFDNLADYEHVEIALNAGTIRAVRAGIAKATGGETPEREHPIVKDGEAP